MLCCLWWVAGSSSLRDPIIAVGGLASIVAGFLTFANIGGAGVGWASAQLSWQRRLPFPAAERTNVKYMYRLIGSLTVGLGAMLVAVGALGLVAAR